MLAKDIMHRHVIGATPQMTLGEIARLFTKNDISGAPVVGPQGGLIGVISKADLIAHPEKTRDELRAEQVMTPWGVSAEEDTPVVELARQMLAKKIHRVIITREGEICGIVTTLNVVRALLTMVEKPRRLNRAPRATADSREQVRRFAV